MLAITVPITQTAPSLDPSQGANSWPISATANLEWDVAHAHAAADPTVVHITSDGKFLYIRFDATQHEPVTAVQRSDDTVIGGVDSGNTVEVTDDAVWVDLWPTGPNGIAFQFESNPNGAHNELSTENYSFSPHWTSRGAITKDGYTVTMAIPLGVLRGAHTGTWHMQFIRYVRATGSRNVWSYDVAQTNPDDGFRAGEATLTVTTRSALAKPRVGIYGLGSVESPSAGGSSARAGVDFSVPVMSTASFYGTVHPDYSNVEIDQQSIAPRVYPYIYSEVRPFFTQGAVYYNQFHCYGLQGVATLYTPAIPTPLDGYGFDGRHGNVSLAAFDAIGAGRADSAGDVEYLSPDTRWKVNLERVSADLPGLLDATDRAEICWWDDKHLSVYVDDASEYGTGVLDRSQAGWLDVGAGWQNQSVNDFFAVRKVGASFNPVDGFDAHPGIAGYVLSSARAWTFSPHDILLSASVFGHIDRYQGVTLGQAQSDNILALDVLTKSAIDITLSTGSSYWRFGNTLTPISQTGGITVTFGSGLATSPSRFGEHGASATPTVISFHTGRYGLGRLDTWTRSSTFRVSKRGSLIVCADDTAQWLPSSLANIQWFDDVAYAYQIAPNSSLAVGIRRVIGFPPQPNGGGYCEGACSNISISYHLRLHNLEYYGAYGNPNTLTTIPQAIFKVIFYPGGEKGT